MDRMILSGLIVLSVSVFCQTVAGEEICSTEGGVVSFCDGEKTYCCYNGTACCSHWYSDMKVLMIGFLCVCAAALVIPLTCTICAYCIFNVILKERNSKSQTDEDTESTCDTKPDRKFPIGNQAHEKYAPEVFISPEEFILDLQGKDLDKKHLIDTA